MSRPTIRTRPVLLIGDSITEQWQVRRPAFFRAYGLLNRGRGGQTTRDVKDRFLAEIGPAAPACVHIMAGLNDIAGNGGPISLSETADNLAWMVHEAGRAGCRVLLGSVTPADVIAWNPAVRPAEPIVALNRRLRDLAGHEGAVFVDYHAVLGTPAGAMRPGLGPDGSHLNARGYRLMEPVLLRALAQALGDERFAPLSLIEQAGRVLARLRGS